MKFDLLQALISKTKLIRMQYIYCMQEVVIHEGVNEIGCALTNNMLNLCCGGLREIEEAKHLEVALAKDKIAYH